MLLMEARNIKKYYSDRLVLELEELSLYTGDKIGIVGLNGSGKTTLLDILAGRVEPDKGFVKRFCDISYIRQFSEQDGDSEKKYVKGYSEPTDSLNLEPGKTIIPVSEQDEDSEKKHIKGYAKPTDSLNIELDEAAIPLSAVDADRDYPYGENPEQLQRLLAEFELGEKVKRDNLSGGEKTRLKIADAFSTGHMLMFADEPTSNLDFKGIELLKDKLQRQQSFVLVSHDRNLLDGLCNKILEIRDGKIRIFNGNYTFYMQQCEKEQKREMIEYEKYTNTKDNLEAAIIGRQQRAGKMRKAPARMGNSEARLHKRSIGERQKKLNNAANSLKMRLDKLEVREKPREAAEIKLDFYLTDPPQNKVIISAEKLNFSYGSVRVFQNASFTIYNGLKTALWGENGTGKTTLLNLIYTGGSSNIRVVPKARLAYFRQGFEHLDENKSVLENVMLGSVQTQTTARTILARLLIQGEDVYKRVGVLSGGEKIKTAFAKMFVSGANILLLDEPTNYLDMQSVEALEEVLSEYEGTVIFVSHDKTFVNAVADRLLVLGNHSINYFEGKLSEYERKIDNDGNSQRFAGAGNISGPGHISAELERSMLQMRITEIIAKLSAGQGDRDKLEEEYRRLLNLL